jgi:hypothetical protein
MKRLLMTIPALLLVGSATGCIGSKWVSNVIVIHNHHFDPASIVVPANTPFDLRFASYEHSRARHTVSFPTLKVEKIVVPGSTRSPLSFEGLSMADLDVKRTPMPPLPIGTYPFVCDCGGENVKGEIIASPSAETQAARINRSDDLMAGE